MISTPSLALRIEAFLAAYANIRPDYDPDFEDETERFTSPDASILFAAQKILEVAPSLPKSFAVDSSWESGGYSPYTDSAGRAIHNQIVADLRAKLKEDEHLQQQQTP